MSFFARDSVNNCPLVGSSECTETVVSTVIKDGVTIAILKEIDPSKDVSIPRPSDYSLEARLAAGVDLETVPCNLLDEKPNIPDDIMREIDSVSKDDSKDDSIDDSKDDSNDDETNV